MTRTADVLVVGAGLAGLCCARRLAERGVSTVVLEAADGIGGRVRSDEVMDFRLDRGFQVLPPEMLFVHRKIGGTDLLCAQLGARVDTAALVRQLAGATPMSTRQ
jgi:phytoene dehydrogenase-like protein